MALKSARRNFPRPLLWCKFYGLWWRSFFGWNMKKAPSPRVVCQQIKKLFMPVTARAYGGKKLNNFLCCLTISEINLTGRAQTRRREKVLLAAVRAPLVTHKKDFFRFFEPSGWTFHLRSWQEAQIEKLSKVALKDELKAFCYSSLNNLVFV